MTERDEPRSGTRSSARQPRASDSFVLRGCRISETMLRDAVNIIGEGFPPGAVSLSAPARGRRLNPVGGTVDEFTEALRATDPSAPDALHELTVSADEEAQDIVVQITPKGVYGHASAVHADFVAGRLGRVAEALRPPRRRVPVVTGPAWLQVVLGALSLAALNCVPIMIGSLATSLLSVLLLASGGGASGAMLGLWSASRSRTVVFLDPRNPLQGSRADQISRGERLLLIATLITLIAIVAGIVLAHYDSTHPQPAVTIVEHG